MGAETPPNLPIRRVNVRQDLFKIADLIELCFSSQLDQEGRDYIRQIRQVAQDTASSWRWLPGTASKPTLPMDGFVWEEQGSLVGNLTLIPFHSPTGTRYLIANVAVHPDYRRRRIAWHLTQQALDFSRQQGAGSAWLQVRDDNSPAYDLYQKIGFQERARRTTWEIGNSSMLALPRGVRLARRQGEDWPSQLSWLRTTYPPEVAWNLVFNSERLRPGFWRELWRFFADTPVRHWAAWRGSELLGLLTWEPGRYRTDTLWLAPNPSCEEEALVVLLTQARLSARYAHSVSINYPAGRAEAAFAQAGFQEMNTLVWMEVKFDPPAQS